MIAIAKHSTDRGEQLEWAKHLRFLTPDRPSEGEDLDSADTLAEIVSDPESALESENPGCVCNDPAVVFEHDTTLRMTAPTDAPDCVHYIAVSYCWASFSEDSSPTTVSYSIANQDGFVRPPRCASTLLSRVIQDATWKQYPFIWIDQECIDQDNPTGQSVGIQSMDLVYQRATECLAVLQTKITEQRYIDALGYLLEGGEDLIKDHDLDSPYEAMQIIMADEWFSRAWCLQESVSGNRRMTVLLQCSDELAIPTIIESLVLGCFELDLYQLHTVLATIGGLIEVLAPDKPELQEKYERLATRWFDNMAPDYSNDYDENSRTTCNAAQVLSYLLRRYNSEVSDRVAIVANLCGYSVRLDTSALLKEQHPFSMCIYVPFIMNGDFSIVLGSKDSRTTGEEDRKGTIEYSKLASRHQEDYPFTWSISKNCQRGGLLWQSHYMAPIRSAITSTSLDQGLAVQGCLWIADHVIDLGNFSSSYKAKLSPNLLSFLIEPSLEDVSKLSELISRDIQEAKLDFLLTLLCHLRKEGYSALHMLLWSWLRGSATERQREVPGIAAYIDAPFHEIIDVDTAAVKWPNPIPPLNPRDKRPPHPFGSLNNVLLQLLLRNILTKGTLTVARPLRTSLELHNDATLFEVQQVNSVVFTPKANGSLDLVPGYGWHPRSWLVAPADKPTDHRDTVRCQRLVSGAWKGAVEHEKTVMLQ